MLFKKKNNVEKLNNILKNEAVSSNLSEYSKPKEFDLKSQSLFSRIIKILFIVLGVSLIGLVIVFYVFTIGKNNNNENNTNDNIKLSIISTNIDLDGKLSYEVSFKNNQKFSIQYANLEVRLPGEFIFLDSDTAADSISDNYAKWTFKDIAPSEEVKLNINGMVFGKVGSEIVMSSVLTYKINNVSSTFTSSNDYSMLITRSLIDVFVDRPNKVESNKEFDYKIKVRNNSNRVFNNVALKFSYNSAYFDIVESSDEASDKNDGSMLFVFDLNKPIDENITDTSNDEYYQKIITIKGSIINDKISNADFDVSLGIVKDMSNLDSIEYLIEKQDSFQLANSGFVFSATSNYDTEDGYGSKIALVSDLSKQYTLNLKYKKESDQTTFKNVKIVLEFVGDSLFNFDKAKYSTNPTITKNEQEGLIDYTLQWSYGNLNNLKDISTTDNSINISIPFDTTFISSKDGLKSIIANLSVYGFDSSNTEILLYKNPSIKVVIDSGFNITGSIKYYDENNDQVGFGPNPPKVGQETKYRVDFNINNKYNNLSNIILNIQLPKNVRYSYEYYTSNGFDLMFDDNNVVRWDVSSMDGNNSVKGFFFVYVTPSSDSLNKSVQVIDSINAKYIDNDLGEDIDKNFGAVLGDKVTN